MDKKSYILGSITIALIIGGTAYAIKRSYDKKKQEEEGMTIEEARELVKGYNPDVEEQLDQIVVESEDEPEPVKPVVFKIDEELPEDEEYEEISEEFLEDGNGFYDDVNFDTPLIEYMTEEDKKLRHEPNSIEAKQQFLKMELAEWVPMEDTYQTMLKLFEIKFEPQNDGDYGMMTKVIDYKSHFFGITSRWTKDVSFGDVIMHFARLADYNIGEGVRYWVNYFLEFNDLHHTTSHQEARELVERMNSHRYYNPRLHTYGLFGLSQFHHEQAIQIANENIDRQVTYEIEFQELLKSAIA